MNTYISKEFVFPKEFNTPTFYCSIKEFLNDEEILKIIMGLKNIKSHTALVGKDGKDSFDHKFRISKVRWLSQNSNKWEWIYSKIIDVVHRLNRDTWNFNLQSIMDDIQYSEYLSNQGGHYDWHFDFGDSSELSLRKISITIQLSDPTEYEGGDLELMLPGGAVKMPKDKGLMVIFPSYFLHRVTPVTKGTRKSLVLWLGGEHFR